MRVVRDAAETGERTQADDDVYNEARAVGVGSHLLPAIAERELSKSRVVVFSRPRRLLSGWFGMVGRN
jgi:hypothetical protein